MHANFIYVKLPLNARGALDIGEPLLHERLEALLAAQQVGTLLGWGTSVDLAHAGDALHPAFHRVDVEATAELAQACALLRDGLAALGVPAGTELHYNQAGQALLELYRGPAGWSVPQAVAGPATARRR